MEDVLIKEDGGIVSADIAIKFLKLYKEVKSNANFSMVSVGNHEGMWSFEFEQDLFNERGHTAHDFVKSFKNFIEFDTDFDYTIEHESKIVEVEFKEYKTSM